MKHTRRLFIRQLGITTMAAAVASCAQRGVTPTTAPTAIPTAPVVPTPLGIAATLAGGNADVWAWEKTVAGGIEGAGCEKVVVQVNDQTVEAALSGTKFSASIPLQEGENHVSAGCDSMSDAQNSITYTARLRNTPRAEIQIQVKVEEIGVLVDASASQPAPQNSAPIQKFYWSTRPGNPGELFVQGKPLTGEVAAVQLGIQLPETDGEYYLRLRVVDEKGREDSAVTYFVVKDGKAHLDDWERQNTAWVENAVVYGVIPRKFGSSKKAFQGITSRLDALQDLGINALWLAPINESPPGDYGYAVMDYFELQERLGTKEDFRQMVEEAHRRDIRVLMDFVPNHSSDEHPYFQDTVQFGEASHYWSFYDRDAAGSPTHYFNWENLPNLNYNNPEVQAWMTEAFAYWVREFDVDGFRVDAAWGIRERNPEYWPHWRKALKRLKPDLLLLAEAPARDPYYFSNGFDAAYDWTGQVGHWAWELVFKKPALLTYNLLAALTNGSTGYDTDALILRFLNNNDTQQRFISQHGIELTRVATIMLLTLPGLPCLYTGDEVGAAFLPYGDPLPLSWEDRDGLFDFHKRIVRLRRETPALHSRSWLLLEAEPHQQVIAYLRLDGENQEKSAPVLVMLNFLDQPAQVQITAPAGFAEFFQQPLRDLLSGEIVNLAGGTVSLLPYSALLLTTNNT